MKRALFWILFLPLQILLLTCLLGVEVARLPFLRRKKQDPGSIPNPKLCTVVVLNWNGRHLLQESLPALLRAVACSGQPHQVLVVDNGSRDGSGEWIRSNFPGVDLLELAENRGFGEGNNAGVQAARHQIVVLLNNDMVVSEDFLPPLLEGFSDPAVFAITSRIRLPADKVQEETGNTQAQLREGYLHLAHLPLRDFHFRRDYLPVWWAGGGSSAIHRRRFLELGGFSPLFSPCYLEDTDLCYRAWRRGWKVLQAPGSQVLHRHRSSTRVRFQPDDLSRMMEERKLWYLWKNFPLRALLPHLALFPLHLNPQFPPGAYLRALRRLPRVLLERWKEPPRVWSHQTVHEWTQHPARYLARFRPQTARKREARLRILLVSSYLPHPALHGGAGRVFHLLRECSAFHDFTLLCFVENEEERTRAEQCRPFCRRLETVYRSEFLPLSFFPYEPFEEFNTRPFREKMEELLAEEEFDLVHFEWTQMALYSDLVPHLPKILTEVEVNYAAHYTRLRVEESLLKKVRLYYNSLQTLYRELELCRRMDRVVCVTDEDAACLAGYLPAHKLRVINTGVDTGYFSPGDPSEVDPDAVVFVGAFRHDPNVDGVHFFHDQIFPRILRHHPSAHFYVVGSSPPESVKRLARHPQVTVTGFVEDIRGYYRKAALVVVPLRTGVGIRGKILEGWACGKAMVATPLACRGIRAVDGENIRIAEDPQGFAESVVELLKNPQECLRLGCRGRETAVRYYDWALLGRNMVQLYEEVVTESEALP